MPLLHVSVTSFLILLTSFGIFKSAIWATNATLGGNDKRSNVEVVLKILLTLGTLIIIWSLGHLYFPDYVPEIPIFTLY